MEDLDILRKRLLYRSQHRGMQEIDLILGKFTQKYIYSMNEQELKQLETLLAFSDQDLYGWFFEKMPLPKEAVPLLVRKIGLFIENL